MAHLNKSDRIKIEYYLNEDYSYRKIVELLDEIEICENGELIIKVFFLILLRYKHKILKKTKKQVEG